MVLQQRRSFRFWPSSQTFYDTQYHPISTLLVFCPSRSLAPSSWLPWEQGAGENPHFCSVDPRHPSAPPSLAATSRPDHAGSDGQSTAGPAAWQGVDRECVCGGGRPLGRSVRGGGRLYRRDALLRRVHPTRRNTGGDSEWVGEGWGERYSIGKDIPKDRQTDRFQMRVHSGCHGQASSI
jgi:hypothetical protein